MCSLLMLIVFPQTIVTRCIHLFYGTQVSGRAEILTNTEGAG